MIEIKSSERPDYYKHEFSILETATDMEIILMSAECRRMRFAKDKKFINACGREISWRKRDKRLNAEEKMARIKLSEIYAIWEQGRLYKDGCNIHNFVKMVESVIGDAEDDYDENNLRPIFSDDPMFDFEIKEPNKQEKIFVFKKELEILINKYSVENESNTPDFILADYILNCLDVYSIVTGQKDRWYKKNTGIDLNEELNAQ